MAPIHCDHQMIAVELPDIYDGVSAWLCSQCDHWQHRWPEGEPRREKTAQAMPPLVVEILADRKKRP